MKRLIALILFFSSIALEAQNTVEISKNIEKATNLYKELFLNKDFSKLSDFASSKLITHLATKQDLIYLMIELDKNLESKGAKIENLLFGQSTNITRYKNELQCVVPFTLEIETISKKVIITSGLALISTDEGKIWFFTFKVDEDNIKNNEILGLEKNIVIPKRTQKIIQK